MLEEPREHEDRNSNIVGLHNNGFYAAVMDEYLGRVQDVSKKRGSIFLNRAQHTALGNVFWKVTTTTQASFKF